MKATLASGQPKEVAWAAYDAGRRNRHGLISTLARLLDDYDAETVQLPSAVSPQAAAIQAVADALIQLEAKLPSQTVMHLYPRFSAQTIILLASSPDPTPDLLKIFQMTQYRDLWLAAGNLLAAQPTPEFIRTLLRGMVTTFVFRVVPSKTAPTPEIGGGCAGDFFMTADATFRDWPKIREYRLVTSGSLTNVFAPGVHPVSFSPWQTTDYRDAWRDGDCEPRASLQWRTGLLAQATGQDSNSIAVDSEVRATILYSSQTAAEEQMKSMIAKQSRAYRDVVELLVQSGVLSVLDSAEQHPKCRIQLQDERPWPRVELPLPDAGSCAIAPPKRRVMRSPSDLQAQCSSGVFRI